MELKFETSPFESYISKLRFDTYDEMFDISPFALNVAVFSIPTLVCSVDRFDCSVVIFDCAIVMLESAVSNRELFEDKALAVADKMLEFEFTSARRSETSDAFVTVFDAALAIAVSRFEFRAITLASVPLRDEMIPSMRLEFEDSWVLSCVTALAWS